MLCLEVAWLTGAARLARDPSSRRPDWPPQPDRIFSALVASWGLGGEDGNERAALTWLEACAPPLLDALAKAGRRDTVDVYVPTNDVPTKDAKKCAEVLPDRRPRRPRRFPAVTLDPDAGPHLRLYWSETPSREHLAALIGLAGRTSYVGHSSSLVRCRFTETGEAPEGLKSAQRARYRGRFDELVRLHKRHVRGRGDPRARPRPSTKAGTVEETATRTSVFATRPEDWVILKHAGGERPDIRATAFVADALRCALMEAWTQANGGAAPSFISGHETDGSPTRDPHVAIVPMAHAGLPFSEGQMMGLAIVSPQDVVERWSKPGPQAYEERQAFLRAVEALGDDKEDGRILALAPRRGRGEKPAWQWRLRAARSRRKSLDPTRYLETSCVWASVTPVLLDRHLKESGEAARDEAEELLSDACERIGLPRPLEVEAVKYSGIRGAPGAWRSTGAPPWSRWSRKKSFGDRKFYHVRLRFGEPVKGAVLLGAGRFLGLGLCLPLYEGGS